MSVPFIGNRDVLLPPELWLNIFELLPRQTVHNVVYVCHTFRWLAQPLLFKKLSTLTSVVVFDYYGRPTHYKLEPATAEDVIQKLEFYLSPRISPFVTTVNIKPIPTIDSVLSRYKRSPKDDGMAQKDLFHILPLFPNLVTLHLKDLTLTAHDLMALKGLAKLETVMLDACDTTCVDVPSIPVKSLSIESRRASPEQALRRLWKAFLQPGTLRSLSLGPWSVIDSNVILSLLVHAGPWPNLHSFRIGYGATEADAFLPFLEQVPNLEELYFHAEDVIPLSDLPSSLVPNLQVYVGPVDTARGIIRGRKQMRHLSVFGSGNVNIIDSHILLDRLTALGPELSSQLWSLQFEAHQLTKAVFKLICEEFVGLRALSIYAERLGDSSDRGKGLADWLSELTMSPDIEYLSITTLQEEPGADTILQEHAMLNLLQKRYPHLRYFYYSIDSYSAKWNPATGQPIKEASKDDWLHGGLGRKLRVSSGKKTSWIQATEPVWVEWKRVCG